jgi:hypothetical protein
VTVVAAGQESVEIMVDQDVWVTVTVSTVPLRANAVAAVKIDAIANPEKVRILFVEALEMPNQGKMKSKRGHSLRRRSCWL